MSLDDLVDLNINSFIYSKDEKDTYLFYDPKGFCDRTNIFHSILLPQIDIARGVWWLSREIDKRDSSSTMEYNDNVSSGSLEWKFLWNGVAMIDNEILHKNWFDSHAAEQKNMEKRLDLAKRQSQSPMTIITMKKLQEISIYHTT